MTPTPPASEPPNGGERVMYQPSANAGPGPAESVFLSIKAAE
jgi:hypothetical protein